VKRIIVIALLMVFALSPGFGQTKTRRTFRVTEAAQGSKIERELIKAENEEIEALKQHDESGLRRILADEFTFVGSRPTGERTHKDRYIDNNLQYTWNSYNFSDFFIRVYGLTAVVNCRFNRQIVSAERESTGDYLFTDVWVKRSGRWQLVARHASQLRG
jgi:hypothetical protein